MGQPEQNTNNQNEIGGLFLWQQTDQLEIILEWEQLEVEYYGYFYTTCPD